MSVELRNGILDEVEKVLLGPIGGEEEELEKNPLDFYTVGVLFPTLERSLEFEDDTPENSSLGSGLDSEYCPVDVLVETREPYEAEKKNRSTKESSSGEEESLELTTKFRPSAAGISVLLKKGSTLNISVGFGTYSSVAVDRPSKSNPLKMSKMTSFKRKPFSAKLDYLHGIKNFDDLFYERNGVFEKLILDDSCHLSIVTRPYEDGHDLEIKTFTLINSNNVSSFKMQRKAECCVFQPYIKILCEQGFHAFEDRSDHSIMDKEDLNLKLLYRKYMTFALGHGISVDWLANGKYADTVETKVLPVEKVNGVDMNPEVYNDKDVLYIKKLSGKMLDIDYKWETIIKKLYEFTGSYHHWIEEQERVIDKEAGSLSVQFQSIAKKNMGKCLELCDRMNEGIKLLDTVSNARKAFEDANRAMFMQRVMADFSRHRRIEKRVLSADSSTDDPLPDYMAIPYDAYSGELWNNGKLNLEEARNGGNLARWRPFQLAFLLSQIKGIIDPTSDDRDTVDLIWFPTGGGKTEAYLGLTAFTIFFRRLTAKQESGSADEGAGVSVLMRYTLRLLNKQQFERAGILICACDLIRRHEPLNYGNLRISNGIWMGNSMTPNRISDQIEDYKAYIKSVDQSKKTGSFRSPPILSCPCCGNRLVKENGLGRWGYFQVKNIKGKGSGVFLIGCTNTKCDFHVNQENYKLNLTHTLPIYEVDEIIYLERPSLLFSTVDKFVQLAWNSSCFSLFNLEFRNDTMIRRYPSPTLIIQDELHLISSSLGTVYGVYEIVIDKLCREKGGRSAKVVGASATVRNAMEQCRRLYARQHFAQFPPPGIDADNSFFSKKIEGTDPKNRMYVGFMTSGTTTSTALIRLTSVLLERIPTLPVSNQSLDNYYTLVVYFNALKELGKFRTFLTDDIVAYRKLLANHFSTFIKPFNHSTLCELSSVMTADEITTGLDRLEKTTLPFTADSFSSLIELLFNKGIRTLQAMVTAQGSLWREFIHEDMFKTIGLNYTGNPETDYATFMAQIRVIFPIENEPVQIAPATNMISVGVDVPRLNTMIINGQPKTTSEYIQASSRVGREGPGIVFSFLSPTKNRDRSHYERFKSFHQAYYYHVESSSVTPFSSPALEKVLPTVLVALTRSLFLSGSNDVLNARGSEYREFIAGLLLEIDSRAKLIYPGLIGNEISNTIKKVGTDFFNRIEQLDGNRTLAGYMHFSKRDSLTGTMRPTLDMHQKVYNAPSHFVDSVLHEYIPTLQTLRNVESSSLISIKN